MSPIADDTLFLGIDFNDASLVKITKMRSSDKLEGFISDIEEFNEYLQVQCSYDLLNNLTQVYVIWIAGYPAGYVDLALTHMRHDATKEIKDKEVESNILALLISRLEVDSTFQGYGVGRALLDMIVNGLVPKQKIIAGCRYLMLKPRDDEGVRNFYHNYGFKYIVHLRSDKISNVDLVLYNFQRVVHKFLNLIFRQLGSTTDFEYNREADAFLLDLIDIPEESVTSF